MENILDYYILPEMPFLEELTGELIDTFRVIAFAGHHTNIRYIRQQQEYFRERYGKHIRHVISEVGELCIVPAYWALQDLLNINHTPKEIRQAAKECLQEYLLPEGYNEEQVKAFEGFGVSV